MSRDFAKYCAVGGGGFGGGKRRGVFFGDFYCKTSSFSVKCMYRDSFFLVRGRFLRMYFSILGKISFSTQWRGK